MRVLPGLIWAVPVLLAGCGGAGEPGEAEAVRAPARAGEVWQVDQSAGRSTSPAALLAYIHGLHVVVLDGNRAYAGMSRLEATSGPEGSRDFALGNGLQASLVKAGEGLELRFSNGESIPMIRREVAP